MNQHKKKSHNLTDSLVQKPKLQWYVDCFSFCMKKPPKKDDSEISSVISQPPHSSMKNHISPPHSSIKNHISPQSERLQKDKLNASMADLNLSCENNVSFLMNKRGTFFCILYNTQKKFSKNNKKQASIFDSQDLDLQNLTQMDPLMAPLQISNYIAQRCQTEGVLLDISAHYGQHTVQFAKECGLVIALERNTSEQLHQTVAAYKCQERVEILNVELKHLFINKFQVDIVFMNFGKSKKLLLNELEELLKLSLQMSKNIVILFSAKFDMKILVDAVYNIGRWNKNLMQRITQIKLSQYISFECEQIMINDELEYQVVYFGSISNFTHNDEISAIGKSLLKDGVLYKNQDVSHTIFEILTQIIKQISLLGLVEILVTVIQLIDNQEIMLKEFLDKIVKEGIMTHRKIQQLGQQNIHHHHNQIFQDKSGCFDCSFFQANNSSKRKSQNSQIESFQITKTVQTPCMSVSSSSHDFLGSQFDPQFIPNEYVEASVSVSNINFLGNKFSKNK